MEAKGYLPNVTAKKIIVYTEFTAYIMVQLKFIKVESNLIYKLCLIEVSVIFNQRIVLHYSLLLLQSCSNSEKEFFLKSFLYIFLFTIFLNSEKFVDGPVLFCEYKKITFQ